ncbi:GDSL esterase/lipase exl3 [Phtheirospermum japonicum]|uniref:GDSL esterase/lipase exl3 n=1 Tax=Phtheirospermum japonicum TaxID=374723 RepID=A0A830CFU4_9LAMI|nr:GDSL esterase/lipase exl3 [Phtheirospermum japonicum]
MTIPAVFSFGDSIVDHGNNNQIGTLITCNFPPYGKDFQGGKPTGRFTNGLTPLDLVGSDDLANTYFTIGTPRPHYDISSYADLLVASASSFVKELYKLGARRMSVFGIPPIGCLPSQRTLAGGALRLCAEDYNRAALLVNAKLMHELDSLDRISLPQSRVVYADVYNPLLDLIQHPQKYVIKLPQNSTIPAVIVFGDSVVDTGNNNYIETIVKVNYPPYGQDFMGGKPTGRFSDGKVPSDLIAEELGIKGLLPAYFDPTLKDEDLLTVLSLSEQLEMFKEYIRKLEKIVGYEKTSTILSQSLIILVTGSNDITNTYFGTPLRKSQYDVSSYADFLVAYASSFVQDLYKLGARRIGVFGLPPLGCLPSQRTLKGGAERECVDLYNQAAEMFNYKLSAEMDSINTRYPAARIIYIDIYKLPLDVIHNPQKYGTIEVAFLCKYTCPDAYEYVFWDSFHLTEKAYRLLVHEILKHSIKSFVL